MAAAAPTGGERKYRRIDSVVFRKTKEEFGGLSNMASGYPLRVNGLPIGTSEVLYQLCRYPHLLDVQRILLGERSPMTAKMKSRPYRSRSRPDFDAVKVSIMRWCLRVKLAQNWDKFSLLLSSTGDKSIVEFSTRDRFWGAGPDGEDVLCGSNVLGRLLMELRRELRGPNRDALRGPVLPPAIPNFVLLGEPIRQVGTSDSVAPTIAGWDRPEIPIRMRLQRADGGVEWFFSGDATIDQLMAQLSRVYETVQTLDIEIAIRERAPRNTPAEDALLDPSHDEESLLDAEQPTPVESADTAAASSTDPAASAEPVASVEPLASAEPLANAGKLASAEPVTSASPEPATS